MMSISAVTRRSQLLLSIVLLFTCCNAQVKPIGEEPLQLKSFDFDTKITALLPEKFKSKNYVDHYSVPSTHQTTLIEKDISYDDQFSSDKKPKWIEYRKLSSWSSNTYAQFEKFQFNSINMVTTLDNKIMVLNGVKDDVTKEESNKLIKRLDKLYGKNVSEKVPSGSRFFDSYTWNLDDRVIKYCISYDDGKSTLKIEVDKTNNTLNTGEKEAYSQGYIFIVDKKYDAKVLGEMNRGDLSYYK